MVVGNDAERLPGGGYGACHIDIGLGRGWVAAGVVVAQDDRGGAKFKRTFHDFTWVGRGVVHGAGLLDLIGDQFVLFIQEQDAEALPRFMGHGRRAVIQQARPAIQDRLADDFLF